MKKLFLLMFLAVGSISANVSSELKEKPKLIIETPPDACFDQAISDLETFERRNGPVNQEVATAILNEAYAVCNAGEQ